MDPSYRLVIEGKAREFLAEDVRFADVSSMVIPDGEPGRASIVAKGSGVLCGMIELDIVFSIVGCIFHPGKQDGDRVMPGDVVATVSGPLRAILLAERTALNLLMLLSGVATTTRTFQDEVERTRSRDACRIAATRKTLPGLRVFQKRAVMVGGGDPHRWSLDDAVLLKDTHRTFFGGDITSMIEACKRTTSFSKKVEVEVETIEDALLAARAGADIIMLDNMNAIDMKAAVDAITKAGLREHVIIESSGNVTIESIANHARAGVDIISTSAITLKPAPVDFSLELHT